MPISTRKPVRLSERCGVSSAENNSGCGRLRIKIVACGHGVSVYPDHGENHPQSCVRSRNQRQSAPKSRSRNPPSGSQANRPKRPSAGHQPKTKPWTPAEVHEAFSRFRKANPEPKGELEHLNPYTLLVAVVLSAQATDAGVNKATRALFAVADTPQKMLALGEDKVRDYIKTIGLYRNKAKNVIALSEKLIAEFGGEVPRTRAETRIRCPAPAARPPTSCSTWRSASTPWRSIPMCFASATAPAWRPAIRRSRSNSDLERVIPAEFMLHAHHWLILHGRYTCLARKPRCEVCLINDLCRWPEKTV